jgi:hypothetical protein
MRVPGHGPAWPWFRLVIVAGNMLDWPWARLTMTWVGHGRVFQRGRLTMEWPWAAYCRCWPFNRLALLRHGLAVGCTGRGLEFLWDGLD